MIFLIALSLLLGACVEKGGRGDGLYNMEDFSLQTQGNETGVCEHYYVPGDNSCNLESCPRGMSGATEEEIRDVHDALREEVEQGAFNDYPPELVNEIESSLGKANVVCIEKGPVRPDGEVYIKGDYCICRKNQPAMIGNCASYCSSVDIPQGLEERVVLYGSVDLGPTITAIGLGNLQGWCTQTLEGSEETAPNCGFVLRGEDGKSISRRPISFTGNNGFRVDLTGLPLGRTYMGKIQEVQSGSLASSDSIQFHLVQPIDTSLIPDEHLKIVPMSQFSCIARPDAVYAAEIREGHYNTALRRFFYFAGNASPMALDETHTFAGQYFCHDTALYGPTDNPIYERLEYIPKQFALWDPTDIRFLNQNQDEDVDVNKMIFDRLAERTGIVQRSKIFHPVNLRPSISVNKEVLAGYIMNPWFYTGTSVAFCPTQAHYQGGDPLFNIIGDFVGIDTEALYAAKRERLTLTDGGGNAVAAPENYLFIREGQLKDIWFILDDGRPLRPRGQDLEHRDEVFLYWPPDPAAPMTRKDNQHLYTLIHTSSENSDEGGQEQTIPTTPTPNDKRIGCVPRVYLRDSFN